MTLPTADYSPSMLRIFLEARIAFIRIDLSLSKAKARAHLCRLIHLGCDLPTKLIERAIAGRLKDGCAVTIIWQFLLEGSANDQ